MIVSIILGVLVGYGVCVGMSLYRIHKILREGQDGRKH